MSNIHEAVVDQLRAFMAKAAPGQEQPFLNGVLRLACKWRSQLISNTLVARSGLNVQSGPFAGMRYLDGAAEGALAARLLGSYESELHPHLLGFVEAGLDEVIDIGAAEGYYAVGLARLAPGLVVHAHDTDPKARALCAELARRNGVEARVRIGGEFLGEDFARYEGGRRLVIVDIEGGEHALLDPDRWPALRSLPLIVETHPGSVPGVTETLIERFRPSHAIEVVHQQPKTTPLPDWFAELGHLDSLLAVWEWRAYPTPWLVMRPNPER